MLKTLIPFLFLIFFVFQAFAQQKPVTVEEEKTKNRINFFVINKNLVDLDVVLKVTGTGFKQRGGAERAMRVPATSRTKVKSVIIERKKYPIYEYTVSATDSLSRRALRPAFEKIKIDPPTPVLLYETAICQHCDTLNKSLQVSPYRYKTMKLAEKPKVAEVIKRALPGLDTIAAPIFSLGGALYTDIDTYEELIERLYEKKEEDIKEEN